MKNNYINYYKQMRVLLIYDLPVELDEDKKAYQKFTKEIKKIGFNMLQYSVYSKVIQNDTSFKQLRIKINRFLPNKGSIILFKITEKQYQDMIYLVGFKNKFDSIIGGNELVVFGGDNN